MARGCCSALRLPTAASDLQRSHQFSSPVRVSSRACVIWNAARCRAFTSNLCRLTKLQSGHPKTAVANGDSSEGRQHTLWIGTPSFPDGVGVEGAAYPRTPFQESPLLQEAARLHECRLHCADTFGTEGLTTENVPSRIPHTNGKLVYIMGNVSPLPLPLPSLPPWPPLECLFSMLGIRRPDL
jgi:hypothetical protein